MKKTNVNVSNPDELNKYLQHTSPLTWVALGLVLLILVGFFSWSFLYKIQIQLTGQATVNSGAVTLTVEESKLNELKVDQLVYIADKETKIVSFTENHQPVVSNVDLDNGEYKYTIVLKETRPIDFLFNK